MAQYKVPQDVEADDKLLGPFSFRQFVYLLIAGILIAIAVALFSVFPLLVLIPVLPALFFIVLALPLKKDQPMETYLAAIVSYYLKPHKRIWTPGQRESTITITAPKIVEDSRTRDITGEEATHRLSFLANIVDTEGQAIKSVNNNSQISDEIVKEAEMTNDMFETTHFNDLEDTIARDENLRHEEVMKEMRAMIAKSEDITGTIKKRSDSEETPEASAVLATPPEVPSSKPDFSSSVVVTPGAPIQTEPVEKSNQVKRESTEKVEKTPPKPSIIELANNTDFSIATIAKEANRINRKEEGEVFISLH
ncbi:PrgI family protein [Candidatus Saccharibacteria bacterium]|nr:PrgI family protein [Candidatus Saccharibacteria bacterium]